MKNLESQLREAIKQAKYDKDYYGINSPEYKQSKSEVERLKAEIKNECNF